MAGTRRVAAKAQSSLQLKSEPPHSLPVYSNELGSLPISRQGPMQQQLSTSWDVGEAINGPSIPPYPYPLPPTSIPLDLDLFNQMDFKYDTNFAQSSSSLQVPYNDHVVDGASNTIGIQQILGVMSDQAQFIEAGQELNGQSLIDNDTVAMWSNPPSGFDLDDWGIYLSNVSELTHGANHPPAG
ncbi:hypothetical protein C0992_008812 [Termitomyces sp. T32_za158]|nr:hypothetical protein C0992_008812 [Termitomyces sp. T32_za158]